MSFNRLPTAPTTIALQQADLDQINYRQSATPSQAQPDEFFNEMFMPSRLSLNSADHATLLPMAPGSPSPSEYQSILKSSSSSSSSGSSSTSGPSTASSATSTTHLGLLYADYLADTYSFTPTFEMDTQPDYPLRALGSASSDTSTIHSEKESFADSYFAAARRPDQRDSIDLDLANLSSMGHSNNHNSTMANIGLNNNSTIHSNHLNNHANIGAHAPGNNSTPLQQKRAGATNKSLISPCLTSATAAAAEEIAASTKRVRRRKNSISEKAAMINPDIRPPLNTIGSRKPLVLPELPPGKTKEDLDPEELAKYKHVHRLLRNRVAALASREKKRLYIEHLEERVATLEKEKSEAEAKLNDLNRYTSALEQHAAPESVYAAASTTSPDPMSLLASRGVVLPSSNSSIPPHARLPTIEEHSLFSPLTQQPTTIAQQQRQQQQSSQSLSIYEISCDDFERMTIAAGLIFVLLYLSVSVQQPSLASLNPAFFSPETVNLRNSNSLSSQIYKVLADPSISQSYIVPTMSSDANTVMSDVWLVSKAQVTDDIKEGTNLHVVAPLTVEGPLQLERIDMTVRGRSNFLLESI
ncbi:hypothetical protein V1511DRAFT_463298 [Dipodascopsis uninucleata]